MNALLKGAMLCLWLKLRVSSLIALYFLKGILNRHRNIVRVFSPDLSKQFRRSKSLSSMQILIYT